MRPQEGPEPDVHAGRASRTYVPLLVLCGSLFLTALAAYQVDRSTKATEQAHYQAQLDAAASEVRDRIAQRREAYVAILHGTAGLFAGDRYVAPAVFAAYVEGLKLEQSYPGVQGLGIVVRSAAAELPKYETYLASVAPTRRVWPAQPPRGEYYPVLHVEPMNAMNRAALGFDVYTDPVRRAALERARDEGTVGVTGKVVLVQDAGAGAAAGAGFVMYYPIYRSGNLPAPATLAERRERVIAFVSSPFRADDFLRGAFPEGRPSTLEFDLYDGREPTEDHLLSRGPVDPAGRGWPAGRPLTIDMGGRTWTLAFRTPVPPPAGAGLSRLALAVGAAGGAISALLFTLTRAQSRARAAAERTAADLGAAAAELRRRDDERVRLLAAERDARGAAEAANRTKDEFLATLSHELRTPLNAILGWAQLLRIGALPADEARQGLETIERSAKAQAQLIDDLLDLSRIIAGKLRVDSAPVDLGAVVRGALDSLRPAAEAKGICVVPVLDADAGSVAGDAGRLQQVAWNLLSNAIKFTPRGGRVDVCVRPSDGDVELTVADNGAGIRPDFLPHVFDRLRQADGSSTRQYGGLGLGLAIVRHLVELHGGTVSAGSGGEGRGAKFTVRLPPAVRASAAVGRPDAAGPRREPPDDGASPVREATDASTLTGVRVLVVDDEPDAREVIRLALAQRGARVETAASASEAMAAFRRDGGPPDVLLSDIAMPGEDGNTLIRRIRRLSGPEGGGVPAVALTAYARADDRDRAMAAGYQVHVPKPVEPAKLLQVVADLLRDARAHDAFNAGPSRL